MRLGAGGEAGRSPRGRLPGDGAVQVDSEDKGILINGGGGLYTPDDGPGWGDVGMTGVPSLLWTGPLDGAGDGACAGATVPNLLCTDPRGVAVVLAGRGERSLAAWAGERPLVRLRRGCGVGDGAR